MNVNQIIPYLWKSCIQMWFLGCLCLTYHSQDPVGFVSAAFWREWRAVQKVLPQPASLGGITAGDRYKLLQQVQC